MAALKKPEGFPSGILQGLILGPKLLKIFVNERKLILNPVDKIFSGAMISSALMKMMTEQLGDFGSLKQNKCKLLCLIKRNIGQAGKWETCPRKQ